MKGFVFVLFISVLIAGTIVGDTISCKDEQGQNVDWFYAYKLPSKFPQNGHGQGVEFVYIKPGSTNWTLSPLPIDSLESVVGQTMAQAYSKESDPNRVVAAYNDEPPGHKSDSLNGHTKGVLVSDDRSGFWVVHSVPLYPTVTENPDDYSYPTTGHHYGQSFLCISVKVEEVDKIGLQLIYNEPHIYTFKISDNLRSLFPNLVEAANKKKITSPPYWNLATIRSTAGVNFESFAKGRHFGKELYEDWVAPTLDTDLYVETWRKGPGVLPSNCTRSTKVWNISSVKVAAIDFTFTTFNDHSKWAVSAHSDQLPWICVGDINRAAHQELRGGGTVCQRSTPIANAYQSLIHSFDSCHEINVKRIGKD